TFLFKPRHPPPPPPARAAHLRLIALPPLTLALPAPGPAPPVADGDTDAETAAGECVHAWARYNPALRRVQLGRGAGRTWARRFQFAGGRGSGGQGDEERRAEAWARAYEE
ncbi:hypothetical protein B0H14DRAFT_2865372, partial [Mycena olivaceomarginata]